ncbi:MAG: hypothetical protein OXC95_04210, partial [Dehalococcoidia bacterium]|nr:hypothetical protein [Dehalococcoidia bacterium]
RNSSKISILSLAIVVLLALSFYFSKDDAVALSMLGHLLYYTTLRDTTELENRDNPEVVVALVSTRSLAELRRAYPNFFADIDMFRRLLQETVG